jgi:single-strand DNA-binding protein
MKSVNRVTLLGRVGQDPVVKSTAGGTLVGNLSLATDDKRKDAQGNWQTSTEWHNLVAFGKTAEVFQQYVRKGAKLYIDGKIQTRQWEKDGQKHYRTEIVVNEMSMLDDKPQSGVPAYSPFQQPAPVKEVDDDDIPF